MHYIEIKDVLWTFYGNASAAEVFMHVMAVSFSMYVSICRFTGRMNILQKIQSSKEISGELNIYILHFNPYAPFIVFAVPLLVYVLWANGDISGDVHLYVFLSFLFCFVLALNMACRCVIVSKSLLMFYPGMLAKRKDININVCRLNKVDVFFRPQYLLYATACDVNKDMVAINGLYLSRVIKDNYSCLFYN